MARYTKSGSVVSVPQINAELEKIEQAFNDVVTRSGQAPNNMQEILDMDNNKITNVLTDLDDPKSLVARADLYVREEIEALDAATLSSAQAYADSGDASTLSSAQSFAQTQDASLRSDYTSRDSAVLQEAQEYALSLASSSVEAVRYIQEELPTGAILNGSRWYKPSEATTYVYFTDGDSAQWVEETTAPSVISNETYTTQTLVLSSMAFSVGTTFFTTGYSTSGDGGQGFWTKSNVTGTPSQSPIQRGNGTFTDALGSVWELKIQGELDPRAVGFTGSGDETASLTAAANAVGEDGKVVLNTSYLFNVDRLNIGNTSFDFANSTIITLSADFGIISEGSFSNQLGVNSVSGNTIVTESVLGANGVSYKPSDIIKITSVDDQADYWSAGRYIGQFAVITEVSGTTITLDREIYDDNLYLTDVNIFKLDGKSARIENFTIKPNSSLTDHATLVEVRSLYKPVVSNVHAVDSRDTAVAYVSCYEYQHLNCSVKNSLDNGATNNFGYGVYDASSHGGYVFNLQANKCRHAFTNGGFGSSSGLDARCGYSTDARIVNGIAREATTGAWDTHPGIINTTFENCQAYDCDNFGQVRARQTRFINPYGRGLKAGIAAAAGKSLSTVNPVKDALVVNPDLEYTETAISYYTGEVLARTDIGDILMEGGTLRPAGNFRGFLLEARNNPIKAVIKNVTIRPSSVDTDSAVFLGNFDGNDIDVNGLDFRSDSNDGGQFSVVRGQSSFSGTVHEMRVQRITFSGAGFENLDLSAVANTDGYVNDVRVTQLGTGSLVAAIGGNSLSWGGAI